MGTNSGCESLGVVLDLTKPSVSSWMTVSQDWSLLERSSVRKRKWGMSTSTSSVEWNARRDQDGGPLLLSLVKLLADGEHDVDCC